MVAVLVDLKNPRDEMLWVPMEAQVKTPFGPATMATFNLPVRWLPPTPATLRSAPQRILPGQSARIVVVFDTADIERAGGPLTIVLLRDGKPDFEFVLQPSEA